jgi:hypothetical protein
LLNDKLIVHHAVIKRVVAKTVVLYFETKVDSRRMTEAYMHADV